MYAINSIFNKNIAVVGPATVTTTTTQQFGDINFSSFIYWLISVSTSGGCCMGSRDHRSWRAGIGSREQHRSVRDGGQRLVAWSDTSFASLRLVPGCIRQGTVYTDRPGKHSKIWVLWCPVALGGGRVDPQNSSSGNETSSFSYNGWNAEIAGMKKIRAQGAVGPRPMGVGMCLTPDKPFSGSLVLSC